MISWFLSHLPSEYRKLGFKFMKSHLNLLFILTSCSTFVAPAAEIPKWVDLFNGKDLSGWVDVNTSPDTWYVKDGMLICKGKPIGVMRSEKQYENFLLHVEWRHVVRVPELPFGQDCGERGLLLLKVPIPHG